MHHLFVRQRYLFAVIVIVAAANIPATASATLLYPTFLPTAMDTAVNSPASNPSTTLFFLELSSGNYVINSGTTPSSWKNALTLDIHNPGLRNGDTFEIRIALEVGTFDPALGISQWIGWRERVLTDGFEWLDGTAFQQATSPMPLPGASNSVSTTNAINDTIDLGFDPIIAGQTLFATKTLRYIGADIAPGEMPSINIDIIANPLGVPEPTALSLLVAGGLALLRRANRLKC